MVEIYDFSSKKKMEPKKSEKLLGKELDIKNVTLLIETIASLIKTMKNPRGTIYLAYRNLVEKKYTDKDLIGQLNNSDKSKWKTNPLFFSAVIDEARKRGLL